MKGKSFLSALAVIFAAALFSAAPILAKSSGAAAITSVAPDGDGALKIGFTYDGDDLALLIASFYNGDRLVSAVRKDISKTWNGAFRIGDIPAEYDLVKAMVWDGTGKMVPLCGMRYVPGDIGFFTPEPEETQPPGGFDGIQLDSGGRLVPTAHKYGKIISFEYGKEPDPGRTVYISPDGYDGKGDGSFENPFESLSRAITSFGGNYAGGAVRIMPGTYYNGIYVFGIHATEEEPFWIGGYDPDDPPVFEGAGLMITGGSYVIMHDFEVRGLRGTTATGIHVTDGGYTSPGSFGAIDIFDGNGEKTHITDTHHFVFRSLYVHDVDYQQFKFSGMAYNWLYDCEISNDVLGGSAAIDCVGVHYMTFAYNYIHDMRGCGIQMKGGSYEGDVFGNMFVNGGNPGINMGQATGFEYFRPPLGAGENRTVHEGSALRAYSNIIVGGSEACVMWGSTDCMFVNNTVVDPKTRLFRVLSADNEDTFRLGNNSVPYNNTVSNNIFYKTPAGGSYYINIADSGTYPASRDINTFKFNNNLFINTSDPGSLPSRDVSLPFLDTILKDPCFEDFGGMDFRLKPISPAIWAGERTDFPKEDFRGKWFRPKRSVGAYEFFGEYTPPTPAPVPTPAPTSVPTPLPTL